MEKNEILRAWATEALRAELMKKGEKIDEHDDVLSYENITKQAEIWGDETAPGTATMGIPIAIKKTIARAMDPGCSWTTGHLWNSSMTICTATATFRWSDNTSITRTKTMSVCDTQFKIAYTDDKRKCICASLAEGMALSSCLSDAGIGGWLGEPSVDMRGLDEEIFRAAVEVKDSKELMAQKGVEQQMPVRDIKPLTKAELESAVAKAKEKKEEPAPVATPLQKAVEAQVKIGPVTPAPFLSAMMQQSIPSVIPDAPKAAKEEAFVTPPEPEQLSIFDIAPVSAPAPTAPAQVTPAPASQSSDIERAKAVICSYGKNKGKTLGYLKENVPAALPWMANQEGRGTEEERWAVALLLAN